MLNIPHLHIARSIRRSKMIMQRSCTYYTPILHGIRNSTSNKCERSTGATSVGHGATSVWSRAGLRWGSATGDGSVAAGATCATLAVARVRAGASASWLGVRGRVISLVAGVLLVVRWRADALGRDGAGGSCGSRATSARGGGARSVLFVVVLGGDVVAGQVVERVAAVGWDDAEGDLLVSAVVQLVPPDVGGALGEDAAGNVLPVRLGGLGAGAGLARLRASNWPTGLGDPHWLALSGADGSVVGLEEEALGVVDAVLVDGLEVWVGINTYPVQRGHNFRVAVINVGSPGVLEIMSAWLIEDASVDTYDVTNWHIGPWSTLENLTCASNVVNEQLWLGTWPRLVLDTSRADTVEILRPN